MHALLGEIASMARLRHFRDGKIVDTVELGEYAVLAGRQGDSDLVLTTPSSSRHHFQLTPRPEGGWLLEDLGSENGTYVDGVREYRKVLLERAVIQVGEEMVVYEPGDVGEPGRSLEPPKFRALPGPRTRPRYKERGDEPITAHVAPAVMRRGQASGRTRLRPHLVREDAPDQPVPLDAPVTTIGYGPVKVSLGPSRTGKEVVLVEVVRGQGFDMTVRAPGMFRKVEVNGKLVPRAALRPGDRFVVDDVVFRFELGITEMAWDA